MDFSYLSQNKTNQPSLGTEVVPRRQCSINITVFYFLPLSEFSSYFPTLVRSRWCPADLLSYFLKELSYFYGFMVWKEQSIRLPSASQCATPPNLVTSWAWPLRSQLQPGNLVLKSEFIIYPPPQTSTVVNGSLSQGS